MVEQPELVTVHLSMSLQGFTFFLNLYKSRHTFSIIKKCFQSKKKIFLYLPSSNSRVTVGSTYSHQCFPSVDTGISQLDHLQAK